MGSKLLTALLCATAIDALPQGGIRQALRDAALQRTTHKHAAAARKTPTCEARATSDRGDGSRVTTVDGARARGGERTDASASASAGGPEREDAEGEETIRARRTCPRSRTPWSRWWPEHRSFLEIRARATTLWEKALRGCDARDARAVRSPPRTLRARDRSVRLPACPPPRVRRSRVPRRVRVCLARPDHPRA